MYERALKLPQHPKKTFFLWGSRQVGKTSLLKRYYPNAMWIQLLKNEEYIAFQERPELLRERIKKNGSKFVIIDEIQKVPALLDEVHYLIEEEGIVFGLCGSSARKIRKQHANLLGGRALRFELYGLTSSELAKDFDLTKLLNHGYLPSIYDTEQPKALLKSYCVDYLKEEVMAEGLVRKLPPFSRFLEAAALGDTEILSYETFARDCGVSAPSVRTYFEILTDTLLGSFLPAYVRRPKRRTVLSSKFYFGDVGVVNSLAQRGRLEPGSELYGKAFENWVYHELKSYLAYSDREESLSFWRLTTGVEVDFIVGHMKCAIEAKASQRIHSDHLKGLKEVSADFPELKKKIVVSLEKYSRRNEQGITILSVQDFVKELWAGKLF